MYKLMIIDDEPMVREGIKLLLPWEKYDFTVCAEGVDGVDGLEKIMIEKPDLVLLDIKMPGLSGIEVIKESIKCGFKGAFIILTGHSDFEFAQSAISLGVRGYLLKPIDEEELINYLGSMKEELNVKIEEELHRRVSEHKARNEVLRNLLLGGVEKSILKRELKQYHLEFQEQSYCVAILNNVISLENTDMSEIILSRMEKFINKNDSIEQVLIDEDIVLIYKGMEMAEFYAYLNQLMIKMKTVTQYNTFITVGHRITHWYDIHYSYEYAKLLSQYEFLYKEKEIITPDILENIGYHCENPLLTEDIITLIEIAERDKLKQLFEQSVIYCRNLLMREAEAKIYFIHLLIDLSNKIARSYDQKKEELPNHLKFLQEMKKAKEIQNLKDSMIAYCFELSEIIGGASTDNIIKRVILFMEKNYEKDIKLETIAKIFHYNSAYLGLIFKKSTKESYNSYLDKIRIKNAKELLLNTDLKVYQVAEKVGYNNIDYFYSKFKKYVGIPPKELKKHHEAIEKQMELVE